MCPRVRSGKSLVVGRGISLGSVSWEMATKRREYTNLWVIVHDKYTPVKIYSSVRFLPPFVFVFI